MYVCICKAVSEKEVAEVIREGHTSLPAVQSRCGAGTDCGSCCGRLTEILSREQQAQNGRPGSSSGGSER